MRTRTYLPGITKRIATIILESEKPYTQLAKEIGIHKSNLWAYVNNGSIPDTKSLIKICRYFGVSADYILFGKGEK